MGAPFTYPVSIALPFEPNRSPIFDGSPGPSGIMSENAQDAIEEALALAIANDRFPLLFAYNGNANTGRYLEFFNNIDSNIAPIYLSAAVKCLTIVGQTTAVNSNAKVGFFRDGILLYEFDFANNKRVIVTGTVFVPIFSFAGLAELSIRVTSGSVNRPHFYAFFSTNI